MKEAGKQIPAENKLSVELRADVGELLATTFTYWEGEGGPGKGEGVDV